MSWSKKYSPEMISEFVSVSGDENWFNITMKDSRCNYHEKFPKRISLNPDNAKKLYKILEEYLSGL